MFYLLTIGSKFEFDFRLTRAAFIYLILLLAISCDSNQQDKSIHAPDLATSFHYLNFEIKPGDLLFQDSDCGPFCESIEKVTFGIHGSKFSHVGIVIPSSHDKLVVLEAIGAGVVQTSLDSFFHRSYDENNKSKVVVGRMKKEHSSLIPDAIEFAKTKIGHAYDDVFDISNNKYYCSELIYDSFKHANKSQPIFQLQPMTYKDPETNETFPIWADYFQKLNIPIPEGKPGLNPGGMSMSNYIDIVHFYGKPQGYTGDTHFSG